MEVPSRHPIVHCKPIFLRAVAMILLKAFRTIASCQAVEEARNLQCLAHAAQLFSLIPPLKLSKNQLSLTLAHRNSYDGFKDPLQRHCMERSFAHPYVVLMLFR